MKRLSYGLAAFLLLCGQPSFTQDKPKDLTPPGSTGMVLTTAEEVTGLRLDLLLQRKVVLEVKTEKLALEQQLLQVEIDAWYRDRSDLKQRLDKEFGCDYDLDVRKCQVKPDEVK